jgi:hypothetical protein
MKALLWTVFISLSAIALAGDSKRMEIPGYVIQPTSTPNAVEWWMPETKPLELSRYSLTSETLKRPLVITILRYSSPEKASKAFQISRMGRPRSPMELAVIHWDAAHRWTTDVCLLKGVCVVSLYDLPAEFPAEAMNKLLEALAVNIAKTEPGSAGIASQPNHSTTNSTSTATNSLR